MAHGIDVEVDRNFDAFLGMLGELLRVHRNEWALLRHAHAVGFYDNEGEALRAGRARFDDGLYSIQQVTDAPVDLGFFGHAIDPRLA